MWRCFGIGAVAACVMLGGLAAAGAADATAPSTIDAPNYVRAEVVEVAESGTVEINGRALPYQTLLVELAEGDKAGQRVRVSNGGMNNPSLHGMVAPGNTVVLQQLRDSGEVEYIFASKYRVPGLLWLLGGFAVVLLLVTRLRGLLALVSLGVSVAALLGVVAPGLVAGYSPLLLALLVSAIIVPGTMFISHGLRLATVLAVAATVGTLGFAVAASWAAVALLGLGGAGDEGVLTIVLGGMQLDLRSLLLAGMITGVAGTLDDVVMVQVAAVRAVWQAHGGRASLRQLLAAGMEVGREHSLSTVNTLAFAYIGASFPLLLLFATGDAPAWAVLSSDMVAEEVARILSGAAALLLAVPLTTLLAASVYSRRAPADTDKHDHAHDHHGHAHHGHHHH